MYLKKVDFLLAVSLPFLAACHKPEPAVAAPTPSVQERRLERAAQVPKATQEIWNYLNRVRQDDPFSDSIARTLVNDQNQLGLVLFSRVVPDQVPELMRKLMTELAQGFPHQDLTLVVYAESVPPHQIGEARVNGQTGEATYTAN